MHPSMSIGRNYRLTLEKTLRKINKTRETTISCKILDEDRHLLNRPHQKGEFEPHKMKTTNDYKCTGVVPLAVNQYINIYILYTLTTSYSTTLLLISNFIFL